MMIKNLPNITQMKALVLINKTTLIDFLKLITLPLQTHTTCLSKEKHRVAGRRPRPLSNFLFFYKLIFSHNVIYKLVINDQLIFDTRPPEYTCFWWKYFRESLLPSLFYDFMYKMLSQSRDEYANTKSHFCFLKGEGAVQLNTKSQC